MIKQILISIIFLSCGNDSGTSLTRATIRTPIEITKIVQDIKNETNIDISQEVKDLLRVKYEKSISELIKYSENIVSAIQIMKEMQFDTLDEIYGKLNRDEKIINKINKAVEFKVNEMLKIFISQLTLEELKELNNLQNIKDYKIKEETSNKLFTIVEDMKKIKVEIEI